MIYLILYILCWAVAGALYLTHPQGDFLSIALLVHLVLGVGFFGFFNFVGHFIFSEKVAKKSVGYPMVFRRNWVWYRWALVSAGCFAIG